MSKISWFIIKINRFIELVFCNQYSLFSQVAGDIDVMSAKGGLDGTKLLYCSNSIDISEMELFVVVGTLGRDVFFLLSLCVCSSFRLILFKND